jgi:glycosyltransferase involved in cell wall biosynthesis
MIDHASSNHDLLPLPERPMVSVIMAAYNASAFISEAIESVLSQSYENIELIVIDDGSKDDTKAKIMPYKGNLRYLRQNNAGVSAARNLGLLSARGDLITCFDADDIMLCDKIEVQVAFLKKHPQVAAVFADYLNFKNGRVYEKSHFQTCPILKKRFSENQGNEIILIPVEGRTILAQENFTIADAPLFHGSILAKVGLFDRNLSQGEDFEFHYRIALAYSIGVIDRILFKRRLHENNSTKKLGTLNIKDASRSREKILLYEKDKLIRREIKSWLRELYLGLAYQRIRHQKMKAMQLTLLSMKYGGSLKPRFYKNLAGIVLR